VALKETLCPVVLFRGLNQACFLQRSEEFGYVSGSIFPRGVIVFVDGFNDLADLGLSVDHRPDRCPQFVQGIDGFKVPRLLTDGNDDRFPGNLPGYEIFLLEKSQIFQVHWLHKNFIIGHMLAFLEKFSHKIPTKNPTQFGLNPLARPKWADRKEGGSIIN
jgi:hypothetical protein